MSSLLLPYDALTTLLFGIGLDMTNETMGIIAVFGLTAFLLLLRHLIVSVRSSARQTSVQVSASEQRPDAAGVRTEKVMLRAVVGADEREMDEIRIRTAARAMRRQGEA